MTYPFRVRVTTPEATYCPGCGENLVGVATIGAADRRLTCAMRAALELAFGRRDRLIAGESWDFAGSFGRKCHVTEGVTFGSKEPEAFRSRPGVAAWPT